MAARQGAYRDAGRCLAGRRGLPGLAAAWPVPGTAAARSQHRCTPAAQPPHPDAAASHDRGRYRPERHSQVPGARPAAPASPDQGRSRPSRPPDPDRPLAARPPHPDASARHDRGRCQPDRRGQAPAARPPPAAPASRDQGRCQPDPDKQTLTAQPPHLDMHACRDHGRRRPGRQPDPDKQAAAARPRPETPACRDQGWCWPGRQPDPDKQAAAARPRPETPACRDQGWCWPDQRNQPSAAPSPDPDTPASRDRGRSQPGRRRRLPGPPPSQTPGPQVHPRRNAAAVQSAGRHQRRASYGPGEVSVLPGSCFRPGPCAHHGSSCGPCAARGRGGHPGEPRTRPPGRPHRPRPRPDSARCRHDSGSDTSRIPHRRRLRAQAGGPAGPMAASALRGHAAAAGRRSCHRHRGRRSGRHRHRRGRRPGIRPAPARHSRDPRNPGQRPTGLGCPAPVRRIPVPRRRHPLAGARRRRAEHPASADPAGPAAIRCS